MKQIQLIEEPKGVFHCDLGLTVDDWKNILTNDVVTKEDYKDALIALYNAPMHRASCKAMAEKNGGDAATYDSRIGWFCKAVVKECNDFQIFHTDGKECFWPVVASMGRNNEDGSFEWTMRPELVSAIDELGWVKRFTWIPFYMEFADKLLQYKDDRRELVDIVYGSNAANYIKSVEGGKVNDIDPFTVFGLFNRGLKDENRIQIIHYFKDKLAIEASVPEDFFGIPLLNNMSSTFYFREEANVTVPLLWSVFVSALNNQMDEFSKSFNLARLQQGVRWNITMGLFWMRPNDFIALDSLNRTYLPKLGFKVFDEKNFNAANYQQLFDEIKTKIYNGELEEKKLIDISYNAWAKGSKVERNYWLVGHSFGGKDSQIERFLADGIWEGGFDLDKPYDIKQISLIKSMKEGDVLLLKSTAVKQRSIPFIRIKALGVISGPVEEYEVDGYTRFKYPIEYRDLQVRDFDGKSYGKYQGTVHKLELSKEPELKAFINEVLSGVKPSEETNSISTKYQPYIDLLKSNHNLVLTGAPGTGKTYMAHEIAKAMGCSEKEVSFVQFHPSYDYTDFVEGLRPIDNDNGQIGFERRDGVFKAFCAKALENELQSAKSQEQQKKELNWVEKLNRFVNESIDNQKQLDLVNGGSFRISDVKGNVAYVYNEANEKTKVIRISLTRILALLNNNVSLDSVGDIQKYFNKAYRAQPDSYEFVITQEIKKMPDVDLSNANQIVPRKNFVFIIDEINRGEASKIFGELFFAIDPGYRGDSRKSVKTQYQNLVEEGDIFYNGFYIPKNVYIIGTMNDIDRSVESMDFAMRRRFTWIEVKPTDTEDMLDSFPDDLASEAKTRMRSLNDAISGAAEYGLGDAFQIGGAYFKKLENYDGDFERLWVLHIEPLLKEYLRGTRYMDKAMKAFEKAYNAKVEEPSAVNTEETDEEHNVQN